MNNWTARRRGRVLLACLVLISLFHLPAAGHVSALAHAPGEDPFVNTRLSPDLNRISAQAIHTQTVRVIAQAQKGNIAGLRDEIIRQGGKPLGELELIDAVVAELPAISLNSVANAPDSLYLSADSQTFSSVVETGSQIHLLATTGASQVIGADGLANNRSSVVQQSGYIARTGVNGSGVTIAVLDSGIYGGDGLHSDLRSLTNSSSSRVIYRRNFVSEEPLSEQQLRVGYDPYGHGTHVAAVAAGAGLDSMRMTGGAATFAGMAFNANLIDLRVIRSDGMGRVSDTIAALQWVVANRQTFNIRVANLSIGALVTDSYLRDPLCRAAESAVASGVAVVVAAGNYGKDAAGNVVYGSVLAPGNHPAVITVGAVSSQQTANRSDDTVASYSSRGPTLVDGIAKPDLVAIGSSVVASCSPDAQLARSHPEAVVYSEGGTPVYLKMSGTSVAAPVVAGTIALMLQANPSLSPRQVKAILRFSAQRLASLQTLPAALALVTQGAGLVNSEAAVRVARAFNSNANRVPAGGILIGSNSNLGPTNANLEFTSIVAGEAVAWGNCIYSDGVAFLHLPIIGFRAFCTQGVRLNISLLSYLDVVLARDNMGSSGVIYTGGVTIISGVIYIGGVIYTGSVTDTLMINQAVATGQWEAENSWSQNLLDQSSEVGSAGDVLFYGEQFAGINGSRIAGPSHALYPRPR